MLDLILVGILIFGFLIGLRRGFILQLIHMVGFIISLIIAYKYYEDLAPLLKLWIPYPDLSSNATFKMVLDGISFDDAFYRVIAFAIIFFAVRIILGIIGSALDIVASLPVIKFVNIWAGGILGLIEMYLLIFILLYIAALIPMGMIQTALNDSTIAEVILKNTPYFSAEVKKWWLDYIQQ
ncbi:CvpA family protein [Bacillus sp. FJAT-49732]|uniref:CvpA family protein n=1 Tax=Lederbergia citrisecunda TaxID=2833583 RepID=A0A942TKL0_9BACI|nr:CvpA family protein [Lederbergia citrisecunda]MBS4199916.1 CvpA family protein [Lederbergia citrisecunda]